MGLSWCRVRSGVSLPPPPHVEDLRHLREEARLRHNRSHSMVATKRRFNPNLQRVRVLLGGKADACIRLHSLPQGRQGHQGGLGGAPRPPRSAQPCATWRRLTSRRGQGHSSREDVPTGAHQRLVRCGRSDRRATSRPRATASSAWRDGAFRAFRAPAKLDGRHRRQAARAGSRSISTSSSSTGSISPRSHRRYASRVAYEVERQTGLTVAAVEVRIEDVRRSS